jgi:hypothetical protein
MEKKYIKKTAKKVNNNDFLKQQYGAYRISIYGTIIIECTAGYRLTTPLHSLQNAL